MMADLNDLRVFEKVALLGSFSGASRKLGIPKSRVSRCVARLEDQLGVRLIQRTTRQVVLTPTGNELKARCEGALLQLRDALEYVESLTGKPSGLLRIGAGIGFGINVLAEQLPEFLVRYPAVKISLDLTSKLGDQVADGIDVAIRLGPLADSGFMCVLLGSMKRCLCASPDYIQRRGSPQTIQDISKHDTIEMPRGDGRPREWSFEKDGEKLSVELDPRIIVNEALTIHRMVLNGAGLGIISGYLCRPGFVSGELVRLLPDWAIPSVDVNIVFPTNRQLAPSVRAFISFMKQVTRAGDFWQAEPS